MIFISDRYGLAAIGVVPSRLHDPPTDEVKRMCFSMLTDRPYRGETRGDERERPCSRAGAASSHQREATLSRARAGP